MALPTKLHSLDTEGVEIPARVRDTPRRLRSDTFARVRPTLLAEVQRHGKFDASCMNCGGCSVVCDLTSGDVTFPRKPIHRVLIGAKDAVLEGLEPWLCHDCGDCSIACPRHADPAASMRTLRRYLTGQYDPTGLATRILRSRAWHLGALIAVGAIVLALVVLYHLKWAGLSVSDFATPLGMEHMFPKIVYFTWIVYLIPVVFLFGHVRRLRRFTLGSVRPALRCYAAEVKTLFVHVTTHTGMRDCPSEARGAPVVTWWLYASERADNVPRRWLKHWLMALGTGMMFVITAAFLRWFQTDSIYPVVHPQRWLGYLATVFILWGTTDTLVRRLRRPKEQLSRERGPLSLPILLWLTALSGIVLHIFRYLGLELATHYTYAIHLAVCVPMVVVEIPFGEWAHMIDRPLALYFQAVRVRAQRELAESMHLAPAPT